MRSGMNCRKIGGGDRGSDGEVTEKVRREVTEQATGEVTEEVTWDKGEVTEEGKGGRRKAKLCAKAYVCERNQTYSV